MAVFLDKDHFIGNRDWLININIIRKMCIIHQIRNQVTRVPSPNSPLSRYWRWVMSWCRGETQDGERGADWYLHHYHHHHHHHSYHDHNSPPGIEGPIGWQPLYHQRFWVASTLLYILSDWRTDVALGAGLNENIKKWLHCLADLAVQVVRFSHPVNRGT